MSPNDHRTDDGDGAASAAGAERARTRGRLVDRPPNLVFLITDQQRADTIAEDGPYRTPNLQALARAGARAVRCYAPNPICSPTRASMLTGLMPHAHGITDVTHAVPATQADLEPGVEFWTSRLAEAGYRIGYFGKWHAERSDDLGAFGIAEYELDLKLTGLASYEGALDPRIEVEQPGYRPFLLAGVTDAPAAETQEARLVDRGIDFLRRAAADGGPWALFVSTEAPHDPYVVPRELYDRYDPAALDLPPSFGDDMADKPAVYRRIAATWRQLSDEQVRQATACYMAACSSVDDQFGRLLAALEATGRAEDTFVVFTSDHGDYLGAHGLFLKGVAPFEEVYKVPLVVRGPGIAPGTVLTEPVSLVDMGATVMGLMLGQGWPGHGTDLGSRLRGASEPAGASAFAQFHGQRIRYTQRIVWRGDLKYVFNGFDEDELYDLAADPHEMRNLAREPSMAGRLREMARAMWAEAGRTGDDTLFEAEYGMFRFAPVGPGAALAGRDDAFAVPSASEKREGNDGSDEE